MPPVTINTACISLVSHTHTRTHARTHTHTVFVACDFFHKMAQAEEVYIQQLMNIVKTFRRKTAELKRERWALIVPPYGGCVLFV